MIKVLQNCSKKNKKCSCIIGVETLDNVPNDKKNKLILYCGDNEDKFYDKSKELLHDYLSPS